MSVLGFEPLWESFLRRDLIKVHVIVVTLCSAIRPASAGSGFWDEEIRNPMGACRYRVSYILPDTIATNTSELVEVTFKGLQLAALTQDPMDWQWILHLPYL